MMGEVWTGNNRIFRTYLKGGGKDGKRCVDRHKGISQVRTTALVLSARKGSLTSALMTLKCLKHS